jgi:hypothetical protein
MTNDEIPNVEFRNPKEALSAKPSIFVIGYFVIR